MSQGRFLPRSQRLRPQAKSPIKLPLSFDGRGGASLNACWEMGRPWPYLNPELRDGLLKTGPGEVVNPFFSAAGLELIVRCDQAPAKLGVVQLPTREELRQQISSQKMSVYAKSYLRDLRRGAIVYGAPAN